MAWTLRTYSTNAPDQAAASPTSGLPRRGRGVMWTTSRTRKTAGVRPMLFDQSPRVQDLQARLSAFMDEHVYPSEPVYFHQLDEGGRWRIPPVLEDLKNRARAAGLWNLFLPDREHGAGLSNL